MKNKILVSQVLNWVSQIKTKPDQNSKRIKGKVKNKHSQTPEYA